MKGEQLAFLVALLVIGFLSLATFTPYLEAPFTGRAIADDSVSVSVSVNAAGTLYAQQGPIAQLWVRPSEGNNWKRITQWKISKVGYNTYAYSGKLSPGMYEFAIVYPNDAQGSGQDRNLFVESLKVNDQSFALVGVNYVFDKGLGRNALDGKTMTEIDSGNLKENGALRGIFFQ